MATVPGNSLQEAMSRATKHIKRPSFGVRGKRRATIVKVYDRDSLEGGEVPSELSRAIQKAPGRLYAQVKLSTGETLYLPFAWSAEMIYSIYGDSQLIEGRAASVVFYDRNPQGGEIEILPDEKKSLTNTKGSTDIFDIGAIFG